MYQGCVKCEFDKDMENCIFITATFSPIIYFTFKAIVFKIVYYISASRFWWFGLLLCFIKSELCFVFQVLREIDANQIQIYQFPEADEEDDDAEFIQINKELKVSYNFTDFHTTIIEQRA